MPGLQTHVPFEIATWRITISFGRIHVSTPRQKKNGQKLLQTAMR